MKVISTLIAMCIFAGCGSTDPIGYELSVSIIQPGPGEYIEDSVIEFEGTGYDYLALGDGEYEQIELKGSQLIWNSSADGRIGTGNKFKLSTLSIGEHIITLTGTGINDIHASTEIQLVITPKPEA